MKSGDLPGFPGRSSPPQGKGPRGHPPQRGVSSFFSTQHWKKIAPPKVPPEPPPPRRGPSGGGCVCRLLAPGAPGPKESLETKSVMNLLRTINIRTIRYRPEKQTPGFFFGSVAENFGKNPRRRPSKENPLFFYVQTILSCSRVQKKKNPKKANCLKNIKFNHEIMRKNGRKWVRKNSNLKMFKSPIF